MSNIRTYLYLITSSVIIFISHNMAKRLLASNTITYSILVTNIIFAATIWYYYIRKKVPDYHRELYGFIAHGHTQKFIEECEKRDIKSLETIQFVVFYYYNIGWA